MVRNVKGFTFVELMISMIILSIVLTIVTGTMVYISRRNSATDEKNHGYQIAKEKLIELQGTGSIVKSTGSDTPERNGIDYDRSWVINTTELPYPITVTVYWTSNGIKDSAKVVGYINSGVCPEISGNQPPDEPKLFQLDGTEITASPIPIGKNGNIFICSLFVDDQNISKGDIVEVDFDPAGTNNDLFKLTTDNHLYSRTTATTPGTYNVKIVATDCDPTNITYKTIPVEIINEFTVEVNEGNASIEENSANGTEVGTASADPGAESWRILSGDPTGLFDINNDGLITVKDETKVNFESETITNPLALILEATYAGKTGTGKFYVTITDVNEAPNKITLSTTEVTLPVSNGDSLALIEGFGDDANDLPENMTYQVLNSTAMALGAGSDSKFNDLIVSKANEFVAGTPLTVTVRAFDPDGGVLSFDQDFTITVKEAASTDGCTCATGCDAITSITSGDDIKADGCYFYGGDFNSGVFSVGWVNFVKINGMSVSHGTSTASVPAKIDGGYYIDIDIKEAYTPPFISFP